MDTSVQVNDIVRALNIEALPKDEQEEILLDLDDLIYKSALVRIIEKMDAPTCLKFEKLLTSDASDTKIRAFLKEQVPEVDNAVSEALEELRGDILAVTQK